MKYRFTISPADLSASNVQPLRQYITSIRADWPSLLGCLVVDDGATQPCIGELVMAQVPDTDAGHGNRDDVDIHSRSLEILADWNLGITVIGLISGVEPAALTGHMDALRENAIHATAAPAATRRIQ